MHRNREATITKIADDFFRGARGILANGNNGESVTESLDRTDSVREEQLLFGVRYNLIFIDLWPRQWGPVYPETGLEVVLFE